MNLCDAREPVDEIRTPIQGHVECTARRRLSDACPYVLYFEKISLNFADGVLTLRGQLPSFYLKQMLQEHLRGIEGVARIDNQVHVVSPPQYSSRLGRRPRRHPSGGALR